MALNFPTSPSVNQVYTYGGNSWQWDGSSWVNLGIQASGITLYNDTFVGNGACTTYYLTTTPKDAYHTIVFVDRVVQLPTEYSVVSNTIIFSAAPDANSTIDVYSSTGGQIGPQGPQGPTGNGISTYYQSFAGTGACTTFTLASAPATQAQALVFVDKVVQSQNAYSVNSTSLILSSAPSNGSNVEVYVYGSSGSGIMLSDRYVSNGSNTTYALSQSSTTEKTFVYFNGVSQRPQIDYQVTGNQLTLNTAAPNGCNVEIRTLGILDVFDLNVAPVSFATDVFTGTGACTVFTLSQGSTTSGTFAFLNGVSQKPGTDFTVGGAGNTTLTLTSAPANGAKLEVRTLGNFKTIENKTRISSQKFTANGVQTVFSLNEPSTSERILVFIDGVTQVPTTDYTVAGNSLTFAAAPLNGSVVEVRNFAVMVVSTSTSDLAYAQANTAYAQANSARGQANTAYGQANTSYGQANSAYSQANAAYAAANTKPSLGLVIALS